MTTPADHAATVREVMLPVYLEGEAGAALDALVAQAEADYDPIYESEKELRDLLVAAEARLAQNLAAWEDEAHRASEAEARLAQAEDALRPIIREYDLWSEDANDGEFRLWDLDRLVSAIVAARAALTKDST